MEEILLTNDQKNKIREFFKSSLFEKDKDLNDEQTWLSFKTLMSRTPEFTYNELNAVQNIYKNLMNIRFYKGYKYFPDNLRVILNSEYGYKHYISMKILDNLKYLEYMQYIFDVFKITMRVENNLLCLEMIK